MDALQATVSAVPDDIVDHVVNALVNFASHGSGRLHCLRLDSRRLR
jgi:hypothetical protein